MPDYKKILNTANELGKQLKEMMADIADKLPAEERIKLDEKLNELKQKYDKLNAKVKNI